MAKVKIGDVVSWDGCEIGRVVAMTLQWCIFRTELGVEFSIPWEEVRILVEPPDEAVTEIDEFDL